MTTTYEVNTDNSMFETGSSLKAARVFVAKLRSGQKPAVYAKVEKDNGVSIRQVYDWANNVKKMQQLIVAAGK